MNPAKTAKTIGLFESGLVTAPEVANSLLFDLLCELELDTAFLASVSSLPEEVQAELISLLRRIQADHYRWSPFVLTTAKGPGSSTEQAEKLRRICAKVQLDARALAPRNGSANCDKNGHKAVTSNPMSEPQ